MVGLLALAALAVLLVLIKRSRKQRRVGRGFGKQTSIDLRIPAGSKTPAWPASGRLRAKAGEDTASAP